MSSILCGSVSWRMVETCVDVWVVFFVRPMSVGCFCDVCVDGSFLVLRRLASLRSFVRRLSCLLSELVRGVCIFLGSGGGSVCAIGQVFCANSWYAFSMVMMWSAALSIVVVVIVGESVSLAM